MMRALGWVLLLSACTEDVDVHAQVPCDGVWIANGYDHCEAGCANSTISLGAMGSACQAASAEGAISCSKTFVSHGVTGCCASVKPRVLFAECD